MSKKKISWPKISIIILSFNGGEDLKRCFNSIKMQTYPSNKIEVVVVDDGSVDDSVQTAKENGARVYINKKRDVYLNWAIALHKITGDFTYMIDQDIELRGKDFLKKMIPPMLEDKRIVACFTRKYPKASQSWITRFLSYHPAQCDPLYEFLTPPVESTFIEEKKNYILCKFILGKVPPFGRMFYRVEYLKNTTNWKQKRVFDHDLVIKTIKAGYDFFAYVPKAGLYHNHAKNLKHLLYKRARNLRMHYFPENKVTEYRWIDVGNKKDVVKMVGWIIYANLFIPAALRGVYRAIRDKDLVFLIEPVVTITITDIILWNFIISNIGREIIMNSVKTLVSKSQSSSLGSFGR